MTGVAFTRTHGHVCPLLHGHVACLFYMYFHVTATCLFTDTHPHKCMEIHVRHASFTGATCLRHVTGNTHVLHGNTCKTDMSHVAHVFPKKRHVAPVKEVCCTCISTWGFEWPLAHVFPMWGFEGHDSFTCEWVMATWCLATGVVSCPIGLISICIDIQIYYIYRHTDIRYIDIQIYGCLAFMCMTWHGVLTHETALIRRSKAIVIRIYRD